MSAAGIRSLRSAMSEGAKPYDRGHLVRATATSTSGPNNWLTESALSLWPVEIGRNE